VTEERPFEPDWCVPPGAFLRQWLDSHNMMRCPDVLALACGGPVGRDAALVLLNEVLAHEPLSQLHVGCVARGTGIPESFWRDAEKAYRDGLAQGRTDHFVPGPPRYPCGEVRLQARVRARDRAEVCQLLAESLLDYARQLRESPERSLLALHDSDVCRSCWPLYALDVSFGDTWS
jgi:hypothetical protein